MIDRRLHVLRALRQHGTVTAAAGSLNLTPSAVSQQLRALARDLGVELVQPLGRGVRLTPAAEVVLEHADALLVRWEQAQADLDAHRLGARGPVRLCGFPSALVALLPAVADELRRTAPDLRLEVIQADPSECLDLLVAGQVDLAILEASPTTPATDDDRFEQQLLFDDPLQLVVPADHPLASRRRVVLADTVGEPWVGGPVGSSYHAIVLLACGRAGFVPTFNHRALDWSAYLAIVGAGLGLALVPRLAVLPSDRVVHVPLEDEPAPIRRVLTCVRRGSRQQTLIRSLHQALEVAADPHRS